MKSFLTHSALLIAVLLLTATSGLHAQGFTSTVTSTTNGIRNNGTIIFKGQSKIKQDTLNGIVEYAQTSANVQHVQIMVYDDVRFSGNSKNFDDTTNNVTNRKNLIANKQFSTSTEATLGIPSSITVYSMGTTAHNSVINPAYLYGKVKMNANSVAQDVHGTGTFKVLELDNLGGADVINGGGFKVHTQLQLTKGVLRNTTTNNFTLNESSTILRTDQGSLSVAPIFSTSVNVHYVGNGNIVAGAELPQDSTILRSLVVQNTGGLTLNRSISVNDSLYLESNVYAEPDTSNPFTLTHTSPNNPIFASTDAEIIGKMRRTNIGIGNVLNKFNNFYTYSQFPDTTSLGAIKEMTFRVSPNTRPRPDRDTSKVIRAIDISAADGNYQPVNSGFNASIGYGWKINPSEELRAEDRDSLTLQNYDTTWKNIGIRDVANATTGNWAYGHTANVNKFGHFAIGRLINGTIRVPVSMLVLMEGPYRNGSMSSELFQYGFLPATPPDMYPYNLDPYRANIHVNLSDTNQVPKNVVDWIVVEFRTMMTTSSSVRTFHTCLVLSDGRVVDYLSGNPSVTVVQGTYYLVIHHRNHLAIMTKDPYPMIAGMTATPFDLTAPDVLLGDYNSFDGMKEIYTKSTTTGTIRYFGMIAGDTNGDGLVDDNDYDQLPTSSWQARDTEGYPSDGNANRANADTDLNGIVNTKDVNVNWNNRGKQTQVPK